ncbi:MAG TPA: ABC transporter permease [Dongiaceae bacterium]|jgi:simple sugar transport system permease protein|nr:ABC transporter permease [Dongiaceae bacterium]
MDLLLTQTFILSLLFGAMKAGLPLLLAGLGEQISEKSGVLNIGIEGMMLFGAYAGFVAAYYSASFWLGFLAGGIGGALVASIVVLLCIRYGLNQIVIGIGVTLGMEGLTALLHYFQFSKTYPRLGEISTFSHTAVVCLALLAVIALGWLFRATYVGINLEAAGNKPAALDAAGVSVVKTRACAVLSTGFLAGVGGAYMANVGAGLFVPFMTGGAGFIGIVLAMLARGRPVWVLLGAALFGISLAMTTALQVAGINIPTDVVQMLPFAMVMLVLVIFARHSVLPPALGLPYVRGER